MHLYYGCAEFFCVTPLECVDELIQMSELVHYDDVRIAEAPVQLDWRDCVEAEVCGISRKRTPSAAVGEGEWRGTGQSDAEG